MVGASRVAHKLVHEERAAERLAGDRSSVLLGFRCILAQQLQGQLFSLSKAQGFNFELGVVDRRQRPCGSRSACKNGLVEPSSLR